MQSRIRSVLFHEVQPRYRLSLGQSRWLHSGISAVMAVWLLVVSWRAHSLASTPGLSPEMRASVWPVFAPEMAWVGVSVAYSVCLSLWSWAAWRRERRHVP
jgi:hypothetical protein